jgi:hypothetical protein
MILIEKYKIKAVIVATEITSASIISKVLLLDFAPTIKSVDIATARRKTGAKLKVRYFMT